MHEKIAEKVSRGPYLAWVCSVLYGCLLSILWMLFTEPLSKSYRLNQYSVWSTWTYLDLLTDNHQVLFILLSCLATELSITLFGRGFERKKKCWSFSAASLSLLGGVKKWQFMSPFTKNVLESFNENSAKEIQFQKHKGIKVPPPNKVQFLKINSSIHTLIFQLKFSIVI